MAISVFCIKIIISNKTRAISLNEGAKKATSEYILFLHADSKIEDDTIRNLINYIKELCKLYLVKRKELLKEKKVSNAHKSVLFWFVNEIAQSL